MGKTNKAPGDEGRWGRVAEVSGLAVRDSFLGQWGAVETCKVDRWKLAIVRGKKGDGGVAACLQQKERF